MKSITLHVSGTHCASCKILIEDVLQEQKGVLKGSVNLKSQTVEIEVDDSISEESLSAALNEKLHANGYSFSKEKQEKGVVSDSSLAIAIPVGLAFLIGFVMLQKSGIFNFGLGGHITLWGSFLIGLLASISSCLAMVGGLVLSLSATVSLDKASDTKPIALFHVGRIGGFALLGAGLGFLGSQLGISPLFSAILGLFAAVVMIGLGLNLLGIFKNVFTLSPAIFTRFRKVENTALAPLLLGVGTFFLPCGFTQSMQVAALASGSLVQGALIMFVFSLGTFPMLALLSFGTASFSHSRYAKTLLASAGVVVTGLGVISVLTGLAALGIINPIISL